MKTWHLATSLIVIATTAVAFQNCAQNSNSAVSATDSAAGISKSNNDQFQSIQFGDFENNQLYTVDLSSGAGEFSENTQAQLNAASGTNQFCVPSATLAQVSALRPFTICAPAAAKPSGEVLRTIVPISLYDPCAGRRRKRSFLG